MQVLMNLIVNGVDAMHDVDGPRELIIKSQPARKQRTAAVSQRYRRGTAPAPGSPIFCRLTTSKATTEARTAASSDSRTVGQW